VSNTLSPGLLPDPLLAKRSVGPTIDVQETSWGTGTATFSADRRYRYRLSRVWDTSLPRANFLLLNPSTADAFVLDPTVRRCLGFARDWGYGAVEITNAYALRSTDPGALRTTADPVGVGNDHAIVYAAQDAQLVVVGWGVHASHLSREDEIRALLVNTRLLTPHPK
jgi:hypothetical protein